MEHEYAGPKLVQNERGLTQARTAWLSTNPVNHLTAVRTIILRSQPSNPAEWHCGTIRVQSLANTVFISAGLQFRFMSRVTVNTVPALPYRQVLHDTNTVLVSVSFLILPLSVHI